MTDDCRWLMLTGWPSVRYILRYTYINRLLLAISSICPTSYSHSYCKPELVYWKVDRTGRRDSKKTQRGTWTSDVSKASTTSRPTTCCVTQIDITFVPVINYTYFDLIQPTGWKTNWTRYDDSERAWILRFFPIQGIQDPIRIPGCTYPRDIADFSDVNPSGTWKLRNLWVL